MQALMIGLRFVCAYRSSQRDPAGRLQCTLHLQFYVAELLLYPGGREGEGEREGEKERERILPYSHITKHTIITVTTPAARIPHDHNQGIPGHTHESNYQQHHPTGEPTVVYLIGIQQYLNLQQTTIM